MKTWIHIALAALASALLSLSPAHAGGGGGGGGGYDKPEAAPDPELGRVLSHARSYVRMQPVHTSVQSNFRMQGLLQVDIALDAPHSQTRRVIEERQIWLRDAYAEAMLIYSGRIYRWGTIPDPEVIARLLQAETDRLIGEGQARVMLDTVIIHAT